jgi:hypothetical protein
MAISTDTSDEEADPRSQRGKEAEVAIKLAKLLRPHFPKHEVEVGKNLLYKIEIEPAGGVSYDQSRGPKRGQFAFQTDILISKTEPSSSPSAPPSTPLVTIELKYQRFSSHDVINYSWKASRHKQIYPYLRYGFVVVGIEGLGRRFVTHNESFDFAMALPSVTRCKNELVPVIKRQLVSAERLLKMMQAGRQNLRRYEETVDIA